MTTGWEKRNTKRIAPTGNVNTLAKRSGAGRKPYVMWYQYLIAGWLQLFDLRVIHR